MMIRPSALGAILSVLLLSGCGGEDTATTAVPSPAATTPTATAPVDGGSDDGTAEGSCVVPAAVKAAASDASVTGVEINGGCQMVSVATTLTKAEYRTAKQICDDVSKVAYEVRDDLMSVNVEGPDGHELAIGLKDQMKECLGEP